MTKTIFLGHEISRPSYIPMTAWLRHGPFAMWLVRAARPGKIVELGSHYGYSYFAFCQAVKAAGLPTRCIAVDTWQGDEHAGRYGEEVFDTVRKENRPYAGFSTLLRKTFAEALDDVEDGSVDILHLDGRHFYDDIKEDYESWRPKLADNAVVLFHDTEVRERGFGVWQYWAELTKTDPSFNFWYQHGLGVLFRGDDLTPEMAAFRRMTQDEAGRDALSALFWAEGHALAGDHTQAVLAEKAAEGPAALSGMLDVLKGGQLVPENQIRPLDGGGAALAASTLVAMRRAEDADLKARAAKEQAKDAASKEQAATEYGNELSARLEALSNTLSHHQAQLQSETTENQLLRGELAYARSHVMKIWKDRLVHRVLSGLASGVLPFSERARLRFAKSARKRDPRRTLIVAGQTAAAAEIVPAPSGEFQVIPGRRTPDPDRRNVLLVSHEASRTGAPILVQNVARVLADRYNVTILSTRGGGILDAFLDVSVDVVITGRNPQPGNSTWRHTERFLSAKPFEFAVVNSIESRRVLPILHGLGITSVSLIHEFASYTRPLSAFAEVMKDADTVVFSSPLTFDNAAETTGLELAPKVHIFPQGKCVVPAGAEAQTVDEAERHRLKSFLRPSGHEDAFLVIGAGHVQIRKGVDLFIEVARHALTKANGRPLRFVWIGDGYDPENDSSYSVYLHDQLKRSGLVDIVRILPPTSEIEYAYELADAMLLTSRLDPLPNVAIDAMLVGVPVLCFDTATGISDILRKGSLEAACVADYLNTSDMEEKLQKLATSPDHYADVSRRTKSHAQAMFDLNAYVSRIEGLALAVNVRKDHRASDAEIIAAEPHFRPDYVLRPDTKLGTVHETARRYLEDVSRGAMPCRPEPGFNPHVYAYHTLTTENGPLDTDPYSDFLTRGRPAGPWSLPVIRETDTPALGNAARKLRCALHIHAYYVDPLEGILARLMLNASRPALFVSVADEAAQTEAARILSSYDGPSQIRVMPNAGRDIGPFLTGFGAELVQDYDVIGHLHTKKSIALVDDKMVARWTAFLQENTLGGEIGGAMLDRVVNAFASDPTLGVVFPSDPHVFAWTRNRDHAARLADRMGLGDLPDAFDFPIGTMFWMRSEALRPFVDLNLGWTDYPIEPIAIDGTMLHALERLFGVAPVLQGYRAAVTSVTGVTR
ncbi:rhamnan synthesis F family protein [Pseudotabrizicola sp. 4114]|uniref:rhamnan synthesis F family protein n=1 Tax=Pseudotabrizicola sp. 4114 TaxID=2817731 RepID=UPI002863C848|nr:glycosyltransferase involved in cell wall biosynthesis [Pseudorhodobacter sp. 4114]